MPVYTYLCKDCGEKFDLLVGMTQDKEKEKCPKCGSKKIEKTMSSFRVKGSGGSSGSCPTCSGGTCSTC